MSYTHFVTEKRCCPLEYGKHSVIFGKSGKPMPHQKCGYFPIFFFCIVSPEPFRAYPIKEAGSRKKSKKKNKTGR